MRTTIGSRCSREFWKPFVAQLVKAEEAERVELEEEFTDEICPTCGRPMKFKISRFGKFFGCSGYPECKTTKQIIKDTGARCPRDGGRIVEKRGRKRGKAVLRLRELQHAGEVRLRALGSADPRLRVRAVRRRAGAQDQSERQPRGLQRRRRSRNRLDRAARTAVGVGVRRLKIVGGGLAGSEAAWQAAALGVPVTLYEMRPVEADRRAQDRRAWPNSSAPTAFARQRSRMPSAFSRKRCRGSVRSSSRRRARRRCRRAARWRWIATRFPRTSKPGSPRNR